MFNILHLPSGHFLQYSNYRRQAWTIPKNAEFSTKAKAGHAIQDYRLGPRLMYPYSRTLYLLPHDYLIFHTIYIRFTTLYSVSSPVNLLSKSERILPVAAREKRLKRINPNMPSKEEFLIMEMS